MKRQECRFPDGSRASGKRRSRRFMTRQGKKRQECRFPEGSRASGKRRSRRFMTRQGKKRQECRFPECRFPDGGPRLGDSCRFKPKMIYFLPL